MRSIDEALAIRLKTSRVNTCCFSIYSNSAELHDRWTQKAGSFRNTIESVTALKRAGISPKAHLVLTRWNVNDVNDLIHYCESIGMEEVRILKLAPAGNAQLNWDCISLPYPGFWGELMGRTYLIFGFRSLRKPNEIKGSED